MDIQTQTLVLMSQGIPILTGLEIIFCRNTPSRRVSCFGGGAVNWSSKRQGCVVVSVAEAEVYALSDVSQYAIRISDI